MKTVSYYDPSTGLFHPHHFAASVAGKAFDAAADMNAPPGCKWIEGKFDHLSQRVDIESDGEIVVDYQPAQPDADHEWNVQIKRWLRRPDVVERENQRAAAQARIDQLEIKAMRPLLDLREKPDDAASAAALEGIMEERAALLPILRQRQRSGDT